MFGKIKRILRIWYLKIKHINEDYCGECALCVDLKNGKVDETKKTIDDFTKKQQILYDHNICLVTNNKIRRDARYKNNIKVVEKY